MPAMVQTFPGRNCPSEATVQTRAASTARIHWRQPCRMARHPQMSTAYIAQMMISVAATYSQWMCHAIGCAWSWDQFVASRVPRK